MTRLTGVNGTKRDGKTKPKIKRLPKGFKSVRDKFYLLRPEAIESVFLLYRITGKKEFQEVAWQMFQSIQNATETEYGNAGIDDVTVTGQTKKRDSMEVSGFFFFATQRL